VQPAKVELATRLLRRWLTAARVHLLPRSLVQGCRSREQSNRPAKLIIHLEKTCKRSLGFGFIVIAMNAAKAKKTGFPPAAVYQWRNIFGQARKWEHRTKFINQFILEKLTSKSP
jgi:hypothetical protein